jgi:hypothetical protein
MCSDVFNRCNALELLSTMVHHVLHDCGQREDVSAGRDVGAGGWPVQRNGALRFGAAQKLHLCAWKDNAGRLFVGPGHCNALLATQRCGGMPTAITDWQERVDAIEEHDRCSIS